MKTKEEIIDKFHHSVNEVSPLCTNIDSDDALLAMQEYSDQNVDQLVNALNKIAQHSYDGSFEYTIIQMKKIATEALNNIRK